MSLVYVAGPYRGKDRTEVAGNIYRARMVGIKLWEMGHAAIVPHLNTSHFEEDCKAGDERYLSGDLEILARCDAIVMTPDWERSSGARNEHAFAIARKIPVFVYPEIPPIPLTEQMRPEQVRAYMDVVMHGYRVHLDKNADYSPANIAGCGEPGLTTRVWDKVSRLMNLMGFRIEIASMHYEAPQAPKNESIEDNLLDLSVYAIIWQLFRQGKWGK
jgi:hypothetical protein